MFGIDLDKTLTNAVADAPREFARSLLERKLKEAGRIDEPLLEALVDHLLAGNGEEFSWDSPDDNNLQIIITDEDLKELDRMITDFLANGVPSMVGDVTGTAGKKFLAGLKRDWAERHTYETQEHTGFRMRLELRWGEALSFLRMLRTMAREIGQDTHQRWSRSRSRKNRYKRNVLLRLHVRGIQVASEIITLLENGFADGAMARWRTLYEIGVVAEVIASHGDELAERYLAYEIVETHSELKRFIECHEALGYKPVSRGEAAGIERRYQATIAKYGADFGRNYGWAAKLFTPRNATFERLEEEAGRAMMKSHYKFASQRVHAGVKALTYQLGTLGQDGQSIAGASNAGLEEPGQNTVITLSQITIHLLDLRNSFDTNVMMLMLLQLRQETVSAFLKAARKLQRDEDTVRAEAANRGA